MVSKKKCKLCGTRLYRNNLHEVRAIDAEDHLEDSFKCCNYFRFRSIQQSSQAESRGFESRFPLKEKAKEEAELEIASSAFFVSTLYFFGRNERKYREKVQSGH